jgi:anti-sigma factor ChrR (cupin superfamily)
VKKELRIIDTVFADESFPTIKALVSGDEIPGTTMKILLEECEAKIVKYDKGSVIPKHKHDSETFKFILRGRIETPEGEQLIAGIGDYRCGGFEYGPWNILEDTYILVLQPKGTKAFKA